MKVLIVLATLALASANAFDLRGSELKQRNLVVDPIGEPEGRITNGHKAAVGQFPYQVGLALKISSTSSSWCGGCLIGKKYVLTAAHCTDGVQSVTVYLGATQRTSPQVTYTVSKDNIIIHSGWNRRTLKNDISLIKIPSTSYSDRIQAVKLPAIANSYSTYAGDSAVASGWGQTYDGSGVTSSLQYVELTVITNTKCAGTYGPTITSSNICVATTNAQSTCQGDSGGPLVSSQTKELIGLTSFGSSAGCTKDYPAAFTRVTSFLPWIHANADI